LQGCTALIRKALISLILQPRDHFTHQLITLREEFICAVFGRLVNLNITFIAQPQRRYFAREDEILDQNPAGSPKEYRLRTFVPPSLIDSDEYWRHVATKCFAISTQLGSPAFLLIFTMNPHKALMRGDAIFADSAIAAIIFKIKLAALMNFIEKHQNLGKVSTFVWRIEYQKRGLPHTHILFWTDFNTQHIDAVDAVINARYPKKISFCNDHGMASDFRQLIDVYQIHHHSKRC
jgi:hypothetical protein